MTKISVMMNINDAKITEVNKFPLYSQQIRKPCIRVRLLIHLALEAVQG